MNQINQNNDEIDLVELLGVIIKWRKVLIIFVLSVTLLGGLFIFAKEYKHYKNNVIAVEQNLNTLSVDTKKPALTKTIDTNNDPLNNIFKFIQTVNPNITDYDLFISKLLFPVENSKPIFNTVFSSEDNGAVQYLFASNKDAEKFIPVYLQFVNSLKKLLNAKAAMTDTQFGQCLFVKEEKREQQCFNYLYNQIYISEKISYAMGTTFAVNILFADVIASVSSFSDRDLKISQRELSTREKKDLLTEVVKNDAHGINKAKMLKYFILVFVLSIFFAVFFAFILEFWVKNKDRMAKYLKK